MRGYQTRQNSFSASPFLGLASPPFWTRFLLIGACSVFVCVFALNFFSVINLVPFLGLSLTGLKTGFVWQLITYPFVQTSVLSLLFNLLVFWLFGSEVEATLGSRSFSKLLLSGIAAAGLVFAGVSFFAPQPVMFGAEVIVFSLLCAYGLMFPEREITLLLLLIFPVRMKAGYLALLMAGITVLMSLGGGAGFGGIFALAAGPAVWLFLRRGERIGRAVAPAAKKMSNIFVVRRPRISVVKSPASGAPVNSDKDDVSRKEIDRILDKISAHGFQSLTKGEKKTLDQARDLFRAGG